MFPGIILATLVAVSSVPRTDDPEVVRKSFVIIKATHDYAEARTLASAAAERLAIRLDLRDLAPDREVGLTFSEEACKNEFGEYPCYVPRGRWDDGVYLSIEHSSSYEGFEEGLYMVILASGAPRDRAIGAAVRRAKSAYPDLVVKTAPVYLGCIH
ncbi:MAG TPA: hypothetical protein VKQ32_05730 [Polyangia bacterium]|nr:hypothetical protein [Polyangia bacterium]